MPGRFFYQLNYQKQRGGGNVVGYLIFIYLSKVRMRILVNTSFTLYDYNVSDIHVIGRPGTESMM